MSSIEKNLLGLNSDIYIYQDKNMFNYSVDTILLGNFINISNSIKKILEIGTNNGALAIFIAARKENLKIDAVEIQEEAIKIAQKNLKLNNKNNQINLIYDDFKNFYKNHMKNNLEKYDSIVSNPPFYKIDSHRMKKRNLSFQIATHEIKLNLEQLILGASKIIKTKGYLSIVMPTERMVDVFCYMRKYNFEPKRIQFIYPRIHKKSNLILIEGRFQTGWGSNILPNIYLHNEEKSNYKYTKEVLKMYKPIKYKRDKNE